MKKLPDFLLRYMRYKYIKNGQFALKILANRLAVCCSILGVFAFMCSAAKASPICFDLNKFVNERSQDLDRLKQELLRSENFLSSTCASLTGNSRDFETSILQMSVEVTASVQKRLVLSGAFSVSRPIVLDSYTTIDGGSGGSHASLMFYSSGTSGNLIEVLAGATNVTIASLNLREVSSSSNSSMAFVNLQGRNKDIKLSKIGFFGKKSSSRIERIIGVRSRDHFVSGLTIELSRFEDLSYGFLGQSQVVDATISSNRFLRWSRSPVYIRPSASRSGPMTANILISHNTIEEPLNGPARFLLFVTRGVDRRLVNNVRIINNLVTGPGIAFKRKPNQSSKAVGDMVAIHGVTNFKISNNRFVDGSENGLTVSRLSQNGVISDNFFEGNDAFSINIGSGYYEITVADASTFKVGDTVVKLGSRTKAKIQKIIGNVLALSPVTGPEILAVDDLVSKQNEQGLATRILGVERTRNIRVTGNTISGNGVNRLKELPHVWELFVMNADNVTVDGNRFFHRSDDNSFSKFLLLNHAVGVHLKSDNQFWHGKQRVPISSSFQKTRSSSVKH